MNRKSLSALVVLNVVLLVALFVIGLTPEPAPAQGLGGGHEFLMIAGKSQIRDNVSSVYLIELQTAQMLALQFDSRNDSLDVVGARNLRPDFSAR
jgi:hypothetical protein